MRSRKSCLSAKENQEKNTRRSLRGSCLTSGETRPFACLADESCEKMDNRQQSKPQES